MRKSNNEKWLEAQVINGYIDEHEADVIKAWIFPPLKAQGVLTEAITRADITNTNQKLAEKMLADSHKIAKAQGVIIL
jgi:hypothetical protein